MSVAGGVICVDMTGIVMVFTEVSAWVDTQALWNRANRNNGRYGFINSFFSSPNTFVLQSDIKYRL